MEGGRSYPYLRVTRGWSKPMPGGVPYTFVNGPRVDPARSIAATIALVFRSSMCPSLCSTARCRSARNCDSTGVTWARYAGANSARIWPIVGTAFTIVRPVAPNIPLNILTPRQGTAVRGLEGVATPPLPLETGAGPPPPRFRSKRLWPSAPVVPMVEGPPRQPHARRLRDHRPRPQRGPRARGDDRPGPRGPRPPVLRREGEARGDRERPRRAGRCRRRPVQRGASPVPALRPREAAEEAVLRPPPADPGDLRGAGPRPGGEAPGRARPPPLRGAPAPGMDPQCGGRGAPGVHGGGRGPRGHLPGDREAEDPPDRGGARARAEGAGPPARLKEGPRGPPRLPRGGRERGGE